MEKLQGLGMKAVAWMGKCEADKVSMGKYDVVEGEEGMYGLVFDNTFSKQVSKTATFVLMTYQTNAPPKSGHHLHFSQAFSAGSTTSLGTKPSPQIQAFSESTDSLAHDAYKTVLSDPRPRSNHATESKSTMGTTFYTGILHKKRRRRNQGFAKRFFSLDFTSSTLSYYQNRQSSALRGAIPLSLAAIAANEKTREISVDSGAEVWHLKALNQKDFIGWRDALEKAARAASELIAPDPSKSKASWAPTHVSNPAEEKEWEQVEALVGRVAGTFDAVRRLAKDTDPKYLPTASGLGLSKLPSTASPSPSETEASDYFREDEKGPSDKVPFWKRKASTPSQSPAGLFRRSVSAQLAVPSPAIVPAMPPLPNGSLNVAKRSARGTSPNSATRIADDDVHARCMEILGDLDSVVAEFSALLVRSKQRRLPTLQPTTSRQSLESNSSDEFFDAEDGGTVKSQLLTIQRDSEESDGRADDMSDASSYVSSDVEGPGTFTRKNTGGEATLFPTKPKDLRPLPMDKVPRRSTIPPPKSSPPSLIGFLRKNVGKDLSTIAMPVSANEPTSLLQRVAEQLEYSELLDAAADAPAESGERILHIAAFAISSFSNSRVKERAIRKPFNPMLGETFELVREDKGYRFLSEKVSHRPVRMACQAEASAWTFLQSPMPVQKFWGKSVELNTDGRARVFIHATSEHYSWTSATSFLRNIIAGEKYVEPVNSMTIINEGTGAKAVATFKAGGMFGGRSEEVTVQAFDSSGRALPLGLQGRWTSHLNLTNNGADTGKAIWNVGELVANAPSRYGFTSFAASLNEVTLIEDGRLPITDSRLRPDQKAAEEGDLDRAEALKARLEERQRARRRVMEEHGEEWQPRWFVKAETAEGEEEIWKLKGGKDGYWEERSKGEFTGLVDVFQG